MLGSAYRKRKTRQDKHQYTHQIHELGPTASPEQSSPWTNRSAGPRQVNSRLLQTSTIDCQLAGGRYDARMASHVPRHCHPHDVWTLFRDAIDCSKPVVPRLTASPSVGNEKCTVSCKVTASPAVNPRRLGRQREQLCPTSDGLGKSPRVVPSPLLHRGSGPNTSLPAPW